MTFSARTIDFAQIADLSRYWRSEYVPLGAGPLGGEMAVAHTPNLQLSRVEYSCGYSQCGQAPNETYAFVVPIDGMRGVFCSRELSELDIAASCSGTETAFHVSGPTKHLVLCVSQMLADRILGNVWAGQSAGGAFLFRFVDGERRLAFLRDAQRLLTMALRYPAMLQRGERAAAFERGLLERLGRAIRPDLRVGPAAERHRLARLAHRYLLDHVQENVSLLELCEALDANERTLLLGFAETYGTAPIAYLRGVRLNGAMRALRSGRGATVTEVASEWGFFHFGRFSAEYRRAFGETPRDTLQGARTAPLPR